ncbi:hypothetical protein Cgig2_012823 [Carnegiea gigantea]|uniref:Uncharacterized protein n=1 Tax=Carnegiea gigantea TaxID=171969 RepID=A0A9Q1GII5_9CARY|nr:hypothetical protein Cgig2_012823 [Carnegiea gigantea]
MGSSVDIIMWDDLKKLKHPGKKIIPLVHRILGFGGQEHGTTGPPPSDKGPWIVPPPGAEALVIHTLASTKPKRKQPEALKTKRIETNKDRRTSDVGVLIIIVLMHHGLITFIIRSRSLTVKWCGLLIALTVFIKPGVPTLGPSLAAVFDVLNVSLKVASYQKEPGAKPQPLHWRGSFSTDATYPLLGLLGLLLLLRLLPAALILGRRLFEFCRSIWRSPIYPRRRASELSILWIHFFNAGIDGIDLMAFNA